MGNEQKKVHKDILNHLTKYRSKEANWCIDSSLINSRDHNRGTLFAMSNTALYVFDRHSIDSYSEKMHKKSNRFHSDLEASKIYISKTTYLTYSSSGDPKRNYCACTLSRIPLNEITSCFRARSSLYRNYKITDRPDGQILEDFESYGYYSLVSSTVPFHISLNKSFRNKNINRLLISWNHLFSIGVEKPKQADLILPYYSSAGAFQDRISEYKTVKLKFDEDNDPLESKFGSILGHNHNIY